MLNRHETHYFLPAPFGLAICGVLFCIWNLLGGTTVPCLGNGCAVFNDFTIAGVSLWWIGAFGFTLLALCALFGRLYLGKTLAACGLWCDIALLVLMLLTTPCLPCLLVAILLALTYLGFVQTASARRRTAKVGFPFLMLLWGLLFVANMGTLGHSLSTTWPMLQAQNEAIRAYISPSCPACRQLIRETPSVRMAGISWYPVAESEQDIRTIWTMIQGLRQGMSLPEAFAFALEQPMLSPWALLHPDMLLLRLRLWRNQAHIMENGGVLPGLEFSGLPAFMVAPLPASSPQPSGRQPSGGQPSGGQPSGRLTVPSSGSTDPTLPGELSILGRCADTSNPTQPCP